MIKQLTSEQFNVLNKLSNRAKMDWFYIKSNKQGDYIFDYELNTKYTLATGIAFLNDGLLDLDEYGLTQKEKNIYNKLLKEIE